MIPILVFNTEFILVFCLSRLQGKMLKSWPCCRLNIRWALSCVFPAEKIWSDNEEILYSSAELKFLMCKTNNAQGWFCCYRGHVCGNHVYAPSLSVGTSHCRCWLTHKGQRCKETHCHFYWCATNQSSIMLRYVLSMLNYFPFTISVHVWFRFFLLVFWVT